MTFTRRQILTGGAAGVGLAVAGTLPSLGIANAVGPASHPSHGGPSGGRPFPPLQDDPAGILALPAGFSYTIASRVGETDLSFGQGKTPDFHDGTAVVGSGRNAITVNASGCTVLTTDGRGNRTGEWVGLSGTVRNCAGGPTPWGNWLTCEEIFIAAGAAWSANGLTGVYENNHGYVFEVFQARSDQQLPMPIKAFGHFEHEAIALEPGLTKAYLTEDAGGPNGLVYRWTAPRRLRLRPGIANQLDDTSGKLQAMQIRLDDGSILPDVAYITSAQLGRPFKVTWTDVPDREATSTPIRKQFADGTVTRGKKFEGI